MQCVSKKLSGEILEYWHIKKKMHHCNNIFQSDSLNIGSNTVIKLHPFTKTTNFNNNKKDTSKNCGILLIITNFGEKWSSGFSSFIDLYFDEHGSKILYATYSGHEEYDRKISGKEILQIMKSVHGIKILDVNEFYRKMKILNVSIL